MRVCGRWACRTKPGLGWDSVGTLLHSEIEQLIHHSCICWHSFRRWMPCRCLYSPPRRPTSAAFEHCGMSSHVAGFERKGASSWSTSKPVGHRLRWPSRRTPQSATDRVPAMGKPNGRPRGEISIAMMKACVDLATPARAPTLREMASRAQVGLLAAKYTIAYLVRCGDLVKVGRRRVAHSRKPVVEYSPAAAPASIEPQATAPHSAAELAAALATWRPLKEPG